MEGLPQGGPSSFRKRENDGMACAFGHETSGATKKHRLKCKPGPDPGAGTIGAAASIQDWRPALLESGER